ncbi:hypothetical protein [Achromobacter denitrificans]|uniref:hypothetical protein n=1 Tax=Achromobacter denitrificans TaxID=32002 RepID=UPI000F6842AE|nr:hypothetical protein [Achromobacter denitrificans]RSE84340.1 hypothetical protein EGU64_14855 [Achromobacter denitrificans]
MSQKTELTAKIDVVDEAGARCVVEQYQSFIQVSSLDGGYDWAPGLRSFKLNGGAVNRIDDQTFHVVATGVRLRRA